MNPPSHSDQTREAEIELLKARLSALEVELIRARQLRVDEIRTSSGPFSFIDRHGMIGLLFGIFVQTAGVIWWASTITNQVHAIQKTVESQQQVLDGNAQVLRENADRLTRVQTVQENVVKILDAMTGRYLPSERGPQIPK